MVNLTRIYTRTGDDGTTALGDLSRTRKTDPRLAAYADANEANAAIGVAVACGDLPEDVRAVLTRVQNDLFDVGADLSTPLQRTYEYPPLRVKEEWVDRARGRLRPLPRAAREAPVLHPPRGHARSRAPPPGAHRRPPRGALGLGGRRGVRHRAGRGPRGEGGVNPVTATYLNRLSDLLFVLARCANLPGGDVLWPPGGGREQTPTSPLTAAPPHCAGGGGAR